MAYSYVAIAFGWTLLWSVALMGVWDSVVTTEEVPGQVQSNSSVNWGYFFLLLLSYFFGHQVIQTMTHVTVAGTVG